MLNVNKGKQSEFVNNRKEEIYKKKKKNWNKISGQLPNRANSKTGECAHNKTSKLSITHQTKV